MRKITFQVSMHENPNILIIVKIWTDKKIAKENDYQTIIQTQLLNNFQVRFKAFETLSKYTGNC